MEEERSEMSGKISENGAGKGLYDEANDGSQAEASVVVHPKGFHHLGEAPCHQFGIVHFVQVAHHGKLHTAA